MGYVPAYCVACAGPISHGLGIDGAVEEANEETVDRATPRWSLPVEAMSWLEELRVVTPAHGDREAVTTGIIEYDDFGVVETADDGAIGLNPCALGSDEDCRPGTPFHAVCLDLVERRLENERESMSVNCLAAAHNTHLETLWNVGGLSADAEGVVLAGLIPSVDYGEGVIDRCEQYYELKSGDEWLVTKPDADGNSDARRNRERIEAAVSQLICLARSIESI